MRSISLLIGGILGVQRDPLLIGHGTGRRFGSQRNGAVEKGGYLCQRTIRHLQFAHTVISIPSGLGQGGNVAL